MGGEYLHGQERKKLQMTLDTMILAGPREVELKGAKLMEQVRL